jgi:hypothetical protein
MTANESSSSENATAGEKAGPGPDFCLGKNDTSLLATFSFRAKSRNMIARFFSRAVKVALKKRDSDRAAQEHSRPASKLLKECCRVNQSR